MTLNNTTIRSQGLMRKLLRPFPLAVVVTTFGAVQIYRTKKQGIVNNEAKPWEITFYRSVPLRLISRSWGWISNRELPVTLRPIIYSKYASYFGVDLQEAESQDLTTYNSLCDFFCRPLKEGIRPIHHESVVSPADGQILSVGKVSSGKVEQVKGVTYSLETFLGESTWTEKNVTEFHVNESIKKGNKGKNLKYTDYFKSLLKNKEHSLYQCVIYLAPGDYHRFHSPVNWMVRFRRHIRGELLSVNPTIAHWIPDLFSLNERAVYIGEWEQGFFSFAAVGATNVGSIRVFCDETLKTNERKWWKRYTKQDVFLSDEEGNNLEISKGSLFGEFRMGSTIVILFEAENDFQFDVKPGDRICMGQALSKSIR